MSCLAVGWGREIVIGELCLCCSWPSARPTTAHSHHIELDFSTTSGGEHTTAPGIQEFRKEGSASTLLDLMLVEGQSYSKQMRETLCTISPSTGQPRLPTQDLQQQPMSASFPVAPARSRQPTSPYFEWRQY